MKKMMKKISALLAIAVLATTLTIGFGVQATESSLLSDGQIGLLQHLGIVPNELPDMNHRLTRGELAHMAAKLMKAPEYTGEDAFFYDVYKENPYRADINALAQAGILHGDGNGYFRPDEEISELEICKVFSVILGYDPIGKFDSYIRIAREAGVSDGLNSDGVVTYEEAMLMAHNTLHCEMMEVVAFGDNNTYKVTEGYLAIERYHGLVKQEGIVDGIPLTTLTEATDLIAAEHIQINGRQFLCKDESLLGKYVVFYSARKSDNSTDKNIAYIYAYEGRNKYLTLAGEDIFDVSATEVKYYVNEKEKSLKITGKTDVIINGVAHSGYTEADLMSPMATLNFIDNNDDAVYDVIIIDDPQYMIIGGIDKETNMIYGQYPEISVGSTTRNVDLEVYLARGKTLLSMVPVGTAVSVSQSKNTTGTLKVRMNQLSNSVTGQVEAFRNNKITVAGKEYKMTDVTVTDEEVRLGDTVTLYSRGDFAAIIIHQASDDYKYGYMIGARNMGGVFSGKVGVQLVGVDRVLYEYDATNPMWVDEIKYTKADAVLDRLLKAAQSRTFPDGIPEEMKAENENRPYCQPIRYKVNEEGLLTHIDTVIYEQDYEQEKSLRPYEDVKSAYYGAGARSFYNGSATTSDFLFSAPAAANIIMPPQQERDLVEKYGTGNPIDGWSYYVEAYTVDPDNYLANYLIVYNKSLETGDSSAIGVITNMYSKLDEDGQVVTVAEIRNPRANNDIILSEVVKNQWDLGDVVLYDYDTKLQLASDTSWRMMFDRSLGKDQQRVSYAYSTDPNYKPAYYNTYTNIRVSYGTVLSYKDGILTHVNAVVEDEEGLTKDGLQNYRTDSVTVYVYEEVNGKPQMSVGSMADVVPYNLNPESGQKTLIGTRSSGRLEYIVVYK